MKKRKLSNATKKRLMEMIKSRKGEKGPKSVGDLKRDIGGEKGPMTQQDRARAMSIGLKRKKKK